MPDIDEILKKARPREHSVTICVAGDLAAEVERLEAQFRDLGEWRPDSIADEDPRVDLARKIQAAREAMRDAQVTFTFRALGSLAWSDLIAKHPSTVKGQDYDPVSLAPALVSACAVDPVMTPEQVSQLFEALNDAQREELIEAAWVVNREPTTVPFSLPASVLLQAAGGEK